MLDGVHADAVTEQRAASSLPRWVDGNDGDLEAVFLIEAEAADQLVGEAGLAGAAGAGDPQSQGWRDGTFFDRPRQTPVRGVFQLRDRPRQQPGVAPAQVQVLDLDRTALRQVEIAGGHDIVDHPLQPEPGAILGRIHARHAVSMQFRDLLRHDHAAATAENLDLLAAPCPQQVDHVLEILDVPALVGRDGDALHIFLQRRIDDFLHRAVVAEMDHFGTSGLQDAPHDVDRGVMAVEQRGGGDEAQFVFRLVRRQLAGDGKVGHGTSPGARRQHLMPSSSA